MKQTLKKLLICTGVLTVTLSGCGSKDTTPSSDKTDKEEKVSLVKNDLYVEPLKPNTAQIKAFNKLSKAVADQDYEEEAKMTAVSFAFDFFTLANKSSNEDVGGLQFIPTTKIFRFKEFAQSYYYNNYGQIVNEYGKDSLPEVTSYKVTSVEAGNYTFNDNPCEGYDVTLTLTYADTDIPQNKLKKSMTITVISITDYPYDRTKSYKEAQDFVGDRINVYRVLSVSE